VSALAVTPSTVYAGGWFSSVSGLPQSSLVGIGLSALVDVPGSSPLAELRFTRLSPNPTSGTTRIGYALPRGGHVRLSVCDLQGRLIARPVDELRPAGDDVAIWEPDPWGSGLYFLRLEYAGRSLTRRLVLIR
jgi:hypothetical protein